LAELRRRFVDAAPDTADLEVFFSLWLDLGVASENGVRHRVEVNGKITGVRLPVDGTVDIRDRPPPPASALGPGVRNQTGNRRPVTCP